MKQKLFKVFSVIALLVMLVVPQTVSATVSEEEVQAMMVSVNDYLAATGQDVRLTEVDLYTHDTPGRIVYISDRGNKQNPDHWLPYDPWRGGTRDITWISETHDCVVNGGAVSTEDVRAAISRAMATWNSAACSSIPLVELDDEGHDWGWVEAYFSLLTPYYFGGDFNWKADFTHAGWQNWIFFELVQSGGSQFILGATYTFTWTARPNDVAFREVYYNDNFPWDIDAVYPYYDIETVALHETGHGLSQGHFGEAFVTVSNGKLHFNPRAVMNSAYSGIQQILTATDLAGHCSIWASWPNN